MLSSPFDFSQLVQPASGQTAASSTSPLLQALQSALRAGIPTNGASLSGMPAAPQMGSGLPAVGDGALWAADGGGSGFGPWMQPTLAQAPASQPQSSIQQMLQAALGSQPPQMGPGLPASGGAPTQFGNPMSPTPFGGMPPQGALGPIMAARAAGARGGPGMPGWQHMRPQGALSPLMRPQGI